MERYKHIPSGKIYKRKVLNNDSLDNFVEEGNPSVEIPHYLVVGNSWRKLKEQSLFTTEDGVEIHEGEAYAFVIRDKEDVYEDFKLYKQPHALLHHVEQDKACPGKYLNFSTVQKAEEYIIKNKPCLSYADLLDLQHNFGKVFIRLNRKQLEHFIKSKLNL